jgi:uncharacterized protein (DUF362 family)
MDRRFFLHVAAAAPAAFGKDVPAPPKYKIVTSYQPTGNGIPGVYPGRVSSVRSKASIDVSTETVSIPVVQEMMRRGMTQLTGDKDPRDSWARFFDKSDTVGIKVNSSGAPGIMSHPVVVTDVVANLIRIGVKPSNIVVHERGTSQMDTIHYPDFLPPSVRIEGANTYMGFDPNVYVETTFFGEDDTRSNLVRMVSEHFTKIINVPNMKDHGASGVTGCLKNVAYGEFNNVARSHYHADTHTRTFIGTLCTVEPLRSKVVLNIMDGLKGVWHAGPFSPLKKFRFYPGQIMFGTDPVAMDRLLIDIIDDERKRHGAISVWERSEKYYSEELARWAGDPNVNRFIREPGHIEFASTLGLGVYDKSKIDLREAQVS